MDQLPPVRLLEDIANEIPDAKNLKTLADHAGKMLDLEIQKKELESQIEEIDEELKRYSQKLLPDLFDAVHTDTVGIPGHNLDVRLDFYYHANIKTEWPEEQQVEGYDVLVRAGGEDLIRTNVTVSFGPSQHAVAMDFLAFIDTWNRKGEILSMTVKKGVPWNTLTKFVKEQTEKGVALPLEKLGATIARVAKIVKRKGGRGR